MTSIAFIQKDGGSIVVYVNGKPYTVDSTALNYKLILKAINESDYENLVKLLDIRKTIADYSNGLVEVFGNDLYFDKKLVKGNLSDRIIHMLKNNLIVDPYVKFMEKLQQNPSESSKNELFLFMESNNLPITPDGDFLAYKAVEKSHDPEIDWTDHYSNTFVNKVGNVVEIPRERVNPNRNEVCSTGLHVCSYEYLGHWYNISSSRLVVCKINPKDVVSVPHDYNNAKMRVCKYIVVDEILDFSDLIEKNYTEKYVEYDDDYDDYENELDEIVDDSTPKVSASSKLSADDVRNIRDLLSSDWTLAGIAREYGISARQVARIRDGEAWASIK